MTTPTVAAITLTPRLMPAVEHLMKFSALGTRTEITGDQLVTLLPVCTLSDGERVLWQALGILAAWEHDLASGFSDPYPGAILTDHPDLDVPNRAALATAVALWEAAS